MAIVYRFKVQPTTKYILEIEENPFLSIEQPNLTVGPILQRSWLRIPDNSMAVLWNPGGHNIL